MTKNAKKATALLTLAAGLGLGLLIGLGMMIGAISAGNHQVNDRTTIVSLPKGIPLEAGTASSGKQISMATGPIDGEVEGVFVLDHLTGKLTCFIANYRALGSATIPLIGQFEANVTADLGLEKGKDTDYVLSVGGISALRGGNTGTSAPAMCVVYVADGNTGNVVGYSLLWNTTLAKSGRPQGGALLRIMAAKARPNIAEE